MVVHNFCVSGFKFRSVVHQKKIFKKAVWNKCGDGENISNTWKYLIRSILLAAAKFVVVFPILTNQEGTKYLEMRYDQLKAAKFEISRLFREGREIFFLMWPMCLVLEDYSLFSQFTMYLL